MDELKTSIKYLIDYVQTNYSDLNINDYLIENNNIIIMFKNRPTNLVLSIEKFGCVIEKLSWSDDFLKNFADKDRKEIIRDRSTLCREIGNQLK